MDRYTGFNYADMVSTWWQKKTAHLQRMDFHCYPSLLHIEKVFNGFLRHYIDTFQRGVVITDDFKIELEKYFADKVC